MRATTRRSPKSLCSTNLFRGGSRRERNLSAALIAIDQGTTSTRAILFDAALNPIVSAQRELRQIYPAPGEVEHDLEEIWSAVLLIVRDCMAQIGRASLRGRGEI